MRGTEQKKKRSIKYFISPFRTFLFLHSAVFCFWCAILFIRKFILLLFDVHPAVHISRVIFRFIMEWYRQQEPYKINFEHWTITFASIRFHVVVPYARPFDHHLFTMHLLATALIICWWQSLSLFPPLADCFVQRKCPIIWFDFMLLLGNHFFFSVPSMWCCHPLIECQNALHIHKIKIHNVLAVLYLLLTTAPPTCTHFVVFDTRARTLRFASQRRLSHMLRDSPEGLARITPHIRCDFDSSHKHTISTLFHRVLHSI